ARPFAYLGEPAVERLQAARGVGYRTRCRIWPPDDSPPDTTGSAATAGRHSRYRILLLRGFHSHNLRSACCSFTPLCCLEQGKTPVSRGAASVHAERGYAA